MSLETETVLDRRLLRRRLGWWRAAAVVVALIALGLLLFSSGTSTVTGTRQIARVTIEGVITEDRDQLRMLKKIADDKRVAGVISGAGDYKPGIVLDKQPSQSSRQPIALLGKVFCKVDAQYGAIGIGDLLTTAPTPGHAMKAGDPFKAFGAVIGKALRAWADGEGLIPILIALQ